MLQVESALKGLAIEAIDDGIGTVSDFLFDDTTWVIRWLVIDTGSWLTGRKVLVHPSAIGAVDHGRKALSVALTRSQVEASPDIHHDQPVSRQMEASLYDYFSWDPLWTKGSPITDMIADQVAAGSLLGGAEPNGQAGLEADVRGEDPHLRSCAAVIGNHILASDGEIGHVKNFLIDDAHWNVRYLIVETRNWWPGKHVLLSPYAVRGIDWVDRQVRVDVSRKQIEASPAWDPLCMVDEFYEKRLHAHYGWSGRRW